MHQTLYLTRNGLLEPLGQSQVFAYLRGLSRDYAITLITYEKAEDLANCARVARARTECELRGIHWLPQRFRSTPKMIAPALSMVHMTWLVWREVRAGRAELIHARSYIPAAVALVVHKLTRTPFIFDMRALWPEELITAGRLTRDSLMHRAIVWIERACLRQSAAVISLTHAAVGYLKCKYSKQLEGQRIIVIPTCADLECFTPAAIQKCAPSPVHGCIGTILSGWFRTDWLAAWLSTVASRNPDALFDIVTRDEVEQVRRALDPASELAGRLNIGPRPSEGMPDAVRGHDLSVMFFTDGLSKLGSAPTRLAEILGCGLPVVVNEGVGDVADIVRKNRVGIIVEGSDKDQMEEAFEALQDLMQDPYLPSRCRATAESLFSLDVGTEKYHNIYASILNTEDSSCVV